MTRRIFLPRPASFENPSRDTSSSMKNRSKWELKHTRTMNSTRRAPSKNMRMKTCSSQRVAIGAKRTTKPKDTIIGTLEASSNDIC